MTSMGLRFLLLIPTLVDGWSSGHSLVNTAVVQMIDADFVLLLNTSTTKWPPGNSISTLTVLEFVKTVWAEAGDTVAGPCSATPATPCSATSVSAKLTLREFCYAEDQHGNFAKPWPYAIPVCNSSTGAPPAGWPGCLPPPRVNPWLYHYFTETPVANEGIEARGAAWYIEKAAAALQSGNATAAALYLSCFSHGLEDRSSPYHCYGGYTDQKSEVDAKYNITGICNAHPDHSKRGCDVIFWAADDTQIDVKVPDYTPAVLGSDFATAGTIVGARMEQLAATARQLGSDPSAGYAAAHVHDPDWWKDANAGPGNTTINAMSQMAQLSTRLVADAWHTAWMFAHQNVTAAKSEETAAGPMLLRRPSPSPAASLAAWNAAVAKAAEYDRREPSFHRTFLDIEMGKETPNKPTIAHSPPLPQPPPPPACGRGCKRFVFDDAIETHGARCLDGSAPGLYFRPGSGDGRAKYLVYSHGGSWCYDVNSTTNPDDASATWNCGLRAKTYEGSSKYNLEGGPPRHNMDSGIMSTDCSLNPRFCNWSVVYFMYCDGSSFTGDRELPHTFTASPHRGNNTAAADEVHRQSAGTAATAATASAAATSGRGGGNGNGNGDGDGDGDSGGDGVVHVWSRGRRNLEALWARMLEPNKFNTSYTGIDVATATSVIVTGASAGGFMTFYHCDYIRSLVPSTIPLRCVPDCAWWPDFPTASGEPVWHQAMAKMTALHNASGGFDASCVAAHRVEDGADPSYCAHPPNVLPYITTPTFISTAHQDTDATSVSALADGAGDGFNHPRTPPPSWPKEDQDNLAPCFEADYTKCTTSSGLLGAFFKNWTDTITRMLAPATASKDHGYFVNRCYRHHNIDGTYTFETKINNVSLIESIGDWVHGGGGSTTKLIDARVPTVDCT